MIKKILIANRGEIALRIIRTCRQLGISTVSIYTKTDKNSPHVKASDESVFLKNNYLDINEIAEIAKNKKADAVHPGYGFLSENPAFARKIIKQSMKFIGPMPDALESIGHKDMTKERLEKAGFSVIPWKRVSSDKQIPNAAEKLGYPIMIKAVFGGGGKGIRKIFNQQQLLSSLKSIKAEAKASFGKEDIYIEKLIQNPHHVEVQIAADKFGNILFLGERDCSTQRKFQKIIEETPSPIVGYFLRRKLRKISTGITRTLSITGVFTIEFLIGRDKKLYFMEINPRIQVEHTITEELYGIDLIKTQIDIANNKILPKKLKPKGYAIECRINAEDIFNDFSPSIGKIEKLNLPADCRIDTFLKNNLTISSEYDSLLAKIIVKAKNRKKGIKRVASILKQLKIDGIKTNKELLISVLNSKKFSKGKNTITENNLKYFIDTLRIDNSLSQRQITYLLQKIVNTIEFGETKDPLTRPQFGKMNKLYKINSITK